ncbi:magnesium transporter [Rosettibacter firmus]|uniref:magnesium transporter n=1 Tax=Rosettibacter firmus TaxID=3111522 RepID=UPI00336BF21B
MNIKPTYDKPIIEFARKDFTVLNKNLTVDEALNKIRTEGVGERIVYFYAVDDEEKLVGVLPTRRLLTAKPETKLEDIMVKRVAALPSSATVYDACEFFVTYKFLAFPVIDEQRKIVGIIDINIFTEEFLSSEPDIEERQRINDIFETIGVNINEVKNASPIKAWGVRFPWFLATVTSGTICALLAGFFEATIEESIIIAFFLTLVLGLAESTSIQSMTLTVQALHSVQPTIRWYFRILLKELKTAFLLALTCSSIVILVIYIWKNNLKDALVIGLSIIIIQIIAAFWGISIPSFLHRKNLDIKISAGPITLAVTDIFTILFYLGIATILM